MLQNYILMSSVSMNQKHMDSISLGINMGFKTTGAGGGVGEDSSGSAKSPPWEAALGACDACAPGRGPSRTVQCTGPHTCVRGGTPRLSVPSAEASPTPAPAGPCVPGADRKCHRGTARVTDSVPAQCQPTPGAPARAICEVRCHPSLTQGNPSSET